MKLEQYRTETLRTLPDLGNFVFNSLHMTVGMMTELTEIAECFIKDTNEVLDMVNLSEEVFDCMWYMSNYATIQDVEFETLKNDELMELVKTSDEYVDPYDYMIIFAGRLLDYDKKAYAYGKIYDINLKQQYFAALYTSLLNFCNEFDLDMEKGMETNIAKLRARFPHKFTSGNAINRDLDQERKILES